MLPIAALAQRPMFQFASRQIALRLSRTFDVALLKEGCSGLYNVDSFCRILATRVGERLNAWAKIAQSATSGGMSNLKKARQHPLTSFL
jgi:hypothetical protein